MTYETSYDHIRQAAEFAAERLLGTPEMHAANFAFVLLEPGDATRYPISVIGNVPMFTGSTKLPQPGEYIVTVHASFGRSYAWAGIPLHTDYATDKWGDGNRRTGFVVSEFLSAPGWLMSAYPSLRSKRL